MAAQVIRPQQHHALQAPFSHSTSPSSAVAAPAPAPAAAAMESGDVHHARRMATMPVQPSPPRKEGFLRRHLGHRQRRSSAVHFPGHTPPSPTAVAHPAPQAPTRQPTSDGAKQTEASPPFIVVDYAAKPRPESSSAATTLVETGTSESETTSDDKNDADATRQDSKATKIRWAEGTDLLAPDGRGSLPSPPERRPSIFAKRDLHVDVGVGSKARRLSVHLPEELEVEESPLEEHFNTISRLHKKNIGEGGAAVVQIMSSKTAGEAKGKAKLYAVKEFRPWEECEETEIEYQRKIKSEFAIAKSLEHPNIVETYRLCYADHHTKWYHVMEFCEVGDVNDVIAKRIFTPEDEDCMFKQLVRGVEYLHSRGIAHRDLKSENLLLTMDGCLKIADFGTSEVFCGKHPGLRKCRRPSIIEPTAKIQLCEPGLVGSRPYMAPEILARKYPYDPRAADMWSVGIVWITLKACGTPWEAAETSVKNYNIYAHSWDTFHERYGETTMPTNEGPWPDFAKTPQFRNSFRDPAMLALAFGLLHPDPAKRTTASQALHCTAVIEMPCCQQTGYSDDIKTRQRKAMHNHVPPKSGKKKNL